ncbi:MAG: HEAT repeat domain-containing protein [Phycisphaerae bacterium]|nr:HEAT repeat domain-containing protein [Phycisphaerae bacterium]
MKTLRYILIAAAGLLVVLPNSALARPKVNVDINIGGRSGFNHNRRPDYGFGRRSCYSAPTWRNYGPRRTTIIIGGSSWYDQRPDYYVVAPPVVVERQPVVIERQTVVYSTISPQVVSQPQQFSESALQTNLELQYRKNELTNQLRAGDKEIRRQAIRDLAGFSFDDNVRFSLENILLSDPDPELRAEAANAFGKVKNANAHTALEKARVEDPNADVRRAADEAIRNIEGN